MIMWNKNILISVTRPFFIGGLVFLAAFISCKSKDDNVEILIEWKGRKPTGIIIPHSMIGNVSQDEVSDIIKIKKRGNETAILGDFKVLLHETVFHPVIPFTRGTTYEVSRNEKVVGSFAIELPKEKAEVLNIYPTADTVPENMLKIYIQFSLPMQPGDALRHISLIKDDRDTLKNVFLDLQNELWSNDQTMLTLWLDPGRIKRGLQPNELLGPPLGKGHHYTLVVHKGWDTEEGVALQTSFKKKFFTGDRDDQMPDIMKWQLSSPRAGTKDSLLVQLNEPLDYQSVKHSVGIYDSDGVVRGRIEIGNNERHFIFYPDAPWKAGKHILDVAPGLEDRAGNNLVQLFDNDLKKPRIEPISSRSFNIQ